MTLSGIRLFLLLLPLLFISTHAAAFEIRNQCPYTVWAAAIPVGGGGQQLDPGQTWTINVITGTTETRIWGRTGCTFGSNGRGRCLTGDCGGVLQCSTPGQPPNTLAEYSLNKKLDMFDISLVDGFNVPMGFSPTSGGCTRGINCTADINSQCPNELRAPGGCNNPCTVFKTNQYCCNSGSCGTTNYSRFFKDRCPNAYSYPLDVSGTAFSCPPKTNYSIVFCP
ncbi:hypothetical protein AAC387_Pa06g1642 [Persea americana]